MAATETGPLRALVVEDEFLVALDVADLLRDEGCQVIGPVGRVAEALGLLETERPDIAFLDVNLAGERSWPVAYRLRERGTHFVFLSGYADVHADIPEDLRAVSLWPKPVDKAKLTRLVRELTSQ